MDTSITQSNTSKQKQKWPVWLIAGLACILILCGIITICAPSVFWKFLDIILGIFLFFSGISWIINAFKNEQKYIGCLIVIGVFASILGILLMFSSSEFVGTLTIWLFAFWALIRGCILIFYGITNKEQNKFRWAIIGLGILLIILFFVIAFSNKGEARALAGICIGISTIFDGILMLIMAFRASNDPSLQDKLIEQADQNEIANTSTTPTSLNDINNTNTSTQPAEQSTTAPATQAETPAPVAVPVPVSVPTPNTTPTVEPTPVEESKPAPEAQPVVVTPEAQPVAETTTPVEESKPAEEATASVEESKPAEEATASVEENKPTEETQTPTV